VIVRWRLVHMPGSQLVVAGDGTDLSDCQGHARSAALEAIRHQLLSANFRIVVEDHHGERLVDAPLVLFRVRMS
jgi:hypothetical protein